MQFEKFNLPTTYMYDGISVISIMNFSNFDMWVLVTSIIYEYTSIFPKLCFKKKCSRILLGTAIIVFLPQTHNLMSETIYLSKAFYIND